MATAVAVAAEAAVEVVTNLPRVLSWLLNPVQSTNHAGWSGSKTRTHRVKTVFLFTNVCAELMCVPNLPVLNRLCGLKG